MNLNSVGDVGVPMSSVALTRNVLILKKRNVVFSYLDEMIHLNVISISTALILLIARSRHQNVQPVGP